MTRKAGRARAIGAGVSMTLLAAIACTDIGPEGVPASIAFDALPYPAVVIGDTLRDANGLAAALSAAVFDARNVQIPDAPVQFIPLDTTITISEEGFVTGETFGTGRIVAQIGTLQTSFQTLTVTRRPDTLVATGATEIVIEYAVPTVELEPIAVRLEHLDPLAPEDTQVPGWTVEFELMGIAPGDTTRGYLVRETSSAKATLDTTNAQGVATVRYRLNPVTFPVLRDTLEVQARAHYRGEPVPGSPVRFMLIIRPAPLT